MQRTVLPNPAQQQRRTLHTPHQGSRQGQRHSPSPRLQHTWTPSIPRSSTHTRHGMRHRRLHAVGHSSRPLPTQQTRTHRHAHEPQRSTVRSRTLSHSSLNRDSTAPTRWLQHMTQPDLCLTLCPTGWGRGHAQCLPKDRLGGQKSPRRVQNIQNR
jgi:hypothetical protein